MKHLLPETYDMMCRIDACATPGELERVVRELAGHRGVTGHLAGIIPSGSVRPRDQPDHVIMGQWPAEWAERYFRRQYVQSDPTIAHARVGTDPLDWRDIVVEGKGRRIMDEAKEFGLREGLTIPQYTLDGLKIGISFSGERIDPSPQGRMALLFLGALATAKAVVLARPVTEEPAVTLTPRERECLLWLAEGKTDWEIGAILGISQRTVATHVERLRGKLGAATRAHAAVTALRLGLLR